MYQKFDGIESSIIFLVVFDMLELPEIGLDFMLWCNVKIIPKFAIDMII